MRPAEDPSAGFALLRALALYLVSVLTAMAALLAWPMRGVAGDRAPGGARLRGGARLG